jgi:hypothetical protein
MFTMIKHRTIGSFEMRQILIVKLGNGIVFGARTKLEGGQCKAIVLGGMVGVQGDKCNAIFFGVSPILTVESASVLTASDANMSAKSSNLAT